MQHGNQSRVHIQELAFGRAEVHSLLQSLEKLRETLLFFALIGHVVSQDACPHHFVCFDDGIEDAIEIKNARAVLEFDRDHTRPSPAFQKPPEPGLDLATHRRFAKLVELVIHNLGIGHPEQVGEPPVHGSECAVQ